MARQIIFDTRENLSLKIVEDWKEKHPTIAKKVQIDIAKLSVADVAAGTKQYSTLNEIKIGSDCEDLIRLESELHRMAMHRQKFPFCDLFLTLIETPRYFHTKKILKILIGLAQKYGVYLSHCQDSYDEDGNLVEVAAMVGMEKIIAIARQTKSEQMWKLPSAKRQKGLSDMGRMFADPIDGVSSAFGQAISDEYFGNMNEFRVDPDPKKTLNRVALEFYDRNMSKLVEMILRRFGLL